MTKELKIIHRRRQREFRKHGKSKKYLILSQTFDSKLLKSSKHFVKKNVDSIMSAKPGQAYKVLKRMGAQPGDNPEDCSFTLPEYVRLGLSADQCADRLAQTFADISQEFPPLVVTNLPTRIQLMLKESENQNIPYISRQMVEEKLSQAQSSKGGVPGDLPTKLIKEFGPELSVPAAQIFRTISRSGKWPKRWRTELGLALKKIPVPLSADDHSKWILGMKQPMKKLYLKPILNHQKYFNNTISVLYPVSTIIHTHTIYLYNYVNKPKTAIFFTNHE